MLQRKANKPLQQLRQNRKIDISTSSRKSKSPSSQFLVRQNSFTTQNSMLATDTSSLHSYRSNSKKMFKTHFKIIEQQPQPLNKQPIPGFIKPQSRRNIVQTDSMKGLKPVPIQKKKKIKVNHELYDHLNKKSQFINPGQSLKEDKTINVKYLSNYSVAQQNLEDSLTRETDNQNIISPPVTQFLPNIHANGSFIGQNSQQVQNLQQQQSNFAPFNQIPTQQFQQVNHAQNHHLYYSDSKSAPTSQMQQQSPLLTGFQYGSPLTTIGAGMGYNYQDYLKQIIEATNSSNFEYYWSNFLAQHQVFLQYNMFQEDLDLMMQTEDLIERICTVQNEQLYQKECYLHNLYKMMAFHYNREQNIEMSQRFLLKSNREAKQYPNLPNERQLQISMLENYLNIAHAYTYLQQYNEGITSLNEALTLSALMLQNHDKENKLFVQKQLYQENPELEYLISLIVDCYKQKYNLMCQYQGQYKKGLKQIREALLIAQKYLYDGQHLIIRDLQLMIRKHLLDKSKHKKLKKSENKRLKQLPQNPLLSSLSSRSSSSSSSSSDKSKKSKKHHIKTLHDYNSILQTQTNNKSLHPDDLNSEYNNIKLLTHKDKSKSRSSSAIYDYSATEQKHLNDPPNQRNSDIRKQQDEATNLNMFQNYLISQTNSKNNQVSGHKSGGDRPSSGKKGGKSQRETIEYVEEFDLDPLAHVNQKQSLGSSLNSDSDASSNMAPNKKLDKVVKNLKIDLQNVREEKDSSSSSSSSDGSKHKKKKHKNKKKQDILVENLNQHKHEVTFNVTQDGQVKSGEGTIEHSDINDREDLEGNNQDISFENDQSSFVNLSNRKPKAQGLHPIQAIVRLQAMVKGFLVRSQMAYKLQSLGNKKMEELIAVFVTKKVHNQIMMYFSLKISIIMDKKLIKITLYDRLAKNSNETYEHIPKSLLKFRKNPAIMAAAIKKKIMIVKVKDKKNENEYIYKAKLIEDDLHDEMLMFKQSIIQNSHSPQRQRGPGLSAFDSSHKKTKELFGKTTGSNEYGLDTIYDGSMFDRDADKEIGRIKMTKKSQQKERLHKLTLNKKAMQQQEGASDQLVFQQEYNLDDVVRKLQHIYRDYVKRKLDLIKYKIIKDQRRIFVKEEQKLLADYNDLENIKKLMQQDRELLGKFQKSDYRGNNQGAVLARALKRYQIPNNNQKNKSNNEPKLRNVYYHISLIEIKKSSSKPQQYFIQYQNLYSFYKPKTLYLKQQEQIKFLKSVQKEKRLPAHQRTYLQKFIDCVEVLQDNIYLKIDEAKFQKLSEEMEKVYNSPKKSNNKTANIQVQILSNSKDNKRLLTESPTSKIENKMGIGMLDRLKGHSNEVDFNSSNNELAKHKLTLLSPRSSINQTKIRRSSIVQQDKNDEEMIFEKQFYCSQKWYITQIFTIKDQTQTPKKNQQQLQAQKSFLGNRFKLVITDAYLNVIKQDLIDLDGLRLLTLPVQDSHDKNVISDLKSFLKGVRPSQYKAINNIHQSEISNLDESMQTEGIQGRFSDPNTPSNPTGKLNKLGNLGNYNEQIALFPDNDTRNNKQRDKLGTHQLKNHTTGLQNADSKLTKMNTIASGRQLKTQNSLDISQMPDLKLHFRQSVQVEHLEYSSQSNKNNNNLTPYIDFNHKESIVVSKKDSNMSFAPAPKDNNSQSEEDEDFNDRLIQTQNYQQQVSYKNIFGNSVVHEESSDDSSNMIQDLDEEFEVSDDMVQ
eukprot:403348570